MKKFIIVAAMILAGALSANAQIYQKGVKISGEGGYYLNTANGDHVGQIELGLGYQINDYLYAGVESGVWGPIESQFSSAIWNVPVLGVARLTVPMESKLTPLVDIACGVTGSAFSSKTSMADDLLPKYTMFQILPGVAYNLSDSFAVKGNVGYLMMSPKEGTIATEQNNILFKLSLVLSL